MQLESIFTQQVECVTLRGEPAENILQLNAQLVTAPCQSNKDQRGGRHGPALGRGEQLRDQHTRPDSIRLFLRTDGSSEERCAGRRQ